LWLPGIVLEEDCDVKGSLAAVWKLRLAFGKVTLGGVTAGTDAFTAGEFTAGSFLRARSPILEGWV